MPINRTTPELIATAERRAFVLAQRKAGYTYAQIAAQAITKFGRERLPSGWDQLYACKDVQRELDFIRKEIAESAEDIITLELERLDVALKAIASKVQHGNMAAIDRWIRIGESRRKLMGVDAPTRTQTEVSGQGGGAIVLQWPNPPQLSGDDEHD